MRQPSKRKRKGSKNAMQNKCKKCQKKLLQTGKASEIMKNDGNQGKIIGIHIHIRASRTLKPNKY